LLNRNSIKIPLKAPSSLLIQFFPGMVIKLVIYLIIIIYLENELKCSSNGKFISAFNKFYGYFEIFTINNSFLTLNGNAENNLMNLSKIEGLHLLSSLQKIYAGCAISLEWNITKAE